MHRLSGSSSDFCISGLTEDCHPASHFDLCSTHSNKFYASPTNPGLQLSLASLAPLPQGIHKAMTCQLQETQSDFQPQAVRIGASEALVPDGSKKKKNSVKSGRRGRPSGTTKLAGYRTSTGRYKDDNMNQSYRPGPRVGSVFGPSQPDLRARNGPLSTSYRNQCGTVTRGPGQLPQPAFLGYNHPESFRCYSPQRRPQRLNTDPQDRSSLRCASPITDDDGDDEFESPAVQLPQSPGTDDMEPFETVHTGCSPHRRARRINTTLNRKDADLHYRSNLRCASPITDEDDGFEPPPIQLPSSPETDDMDPFESLQDGSRNSFSPRSPDSFERSSPIPNRYLHFESVLFDSSDIKEEENEGRGGVQDVKPFQHSSNTTQVRDVTGSKSTCYSGVERRTYKPTVFNLMSKTISELNPTLSPSALPEITMRDEWNMGEESDSDVDLTSPVDPGLVSPAGTNSNYLLPGRQRNNESTLSGSVNGEEHLTSPPPAEEPSENPSVSIVPNRPTSPAPATNGNAHHLFKNSAAHGNKSKAFKKKKKCLSDIFGHIIGGKEPSSKAGQLHTTTRALKEEPKDSPYADLDSVPMLNRPKRTALSPIYDTDTTDRKERGSAKVKKTFKKLNLCTDFSYSSCIFQNKPSSADVDPEQRPGELSHGSSEKHSGTLSASSRLITKALKAAEETDLKDGSTTRRISSEGPSDNCFDKTSTDSAIKTELSPNRKTPSKSRSFVNHSSPKRRARKLDKKLIHNGSDGKELRFKSLGIEDDSDSELGAFRPDSNYKFSTFLMLLKDMHDTREKEGKPLVLPQSATLIKEEPLVIPTATEGDSLRGSCDGLPLQIKLEIGQSEKPTLSQSTPVKAKLCTTEDVSAKTYHCEDFSPHVEVGSSEKQRRKQRLPSKLKLRTPEPSLNETDTGFISVHPDLSEPVSNSLGPNFSTSCIERSSEIVVAPKKRWQLVEEAAETEAAGSETYAEMKGSPTMRASPDLDRSAEAHAENDSHSSDASSTAGKSQAGAL
ncbi:hypothetical protein GOODEAATRI_022933 [Goodea atripinnis]|uniref:Uncharacterized protein n=1 Tax=Goodea atripinnis TaxID=208336 RepID=A0ABV0NYA2_9TELE